MEIEQLKASWNAGGNVEKTDLKILAMLDSSNHPVLKGIRKQIIIEVVAWSAFLFCYYSMLDGDQKPVAINILLIGCVLVSLVHNVFGYNFSKRLIHGENLAVSIAQYIGKMKVFAIQSIAARVICTTGLLIFLTYNITFTGYKYVLLAIMIGVLFLQFGLLCIIWMRRYRTLRSTLSDLVS